MFGIYKKLNKIFTKKTNISEEGSNDEVLTFIKANALGSFPSYALSMHDDLAKPNKRLLETAVASFRRATEIDLSRNTCLFPPGGVAAEDVQLYCNVFPGEHYRLLAAIVDVMVPKLVVEIGTYRGLGVLAMKPYLLSASKIITYDIIPWQEIQGSALISDHFDAQLEQRLYDLSAPDISNEEIQILENADLIFVDAAKDGDMEYKFCALFEKIAFKKPPVVVFGDIRMMQMIKIWRSIRYPKIDVTSFGHWSGTGLVEWGGDQD